MEEEEEIMGEGRNPEAELKGWSKTNAWQPDEIHVAGICHILPDEKLTTVGRTTKKNLVIWASDADGDLIRLASRTKEEKKRCFPLTKEELQELLRKNKENSSEDVG